MFQSRRVLLDMVLLLPMLGCADEQCAGIDPFLGRYWQADEDLADRAGGMDACFAVYPPPAQDVMFLWADGELEGPVAWERDDRGRVSWPDEQVVLEYEYAGADAWDVTLRRGLLARSWTTTRCAWL
jgi:hypothetical protein